MGWATTRYRTWELHARCQQKQPMDQPSHLSLQQEPPPHWQRQTLSKGELVHSLLSLEAKNKDKLAVLFQCLTTACPVQLQLIYLQVTDETLTDRCRVKGHHAQTESLKISLALSMTSAQLVLSSSSTITWEAHPELHRGKRSNIKKGIPKESGWCVYKSCPSQYFMSLPARAGLLRTGCTNTHFLCSTKEINLFDPPCCSLKAAMTEENWGNDDLLLIYLPSSTSHFRFSKSSSSRLATCGRGHLQHRRGSYNFC